MNVNKRFLQLITILSLVSFLFGCSANNDPQEADLNNKESEAEKSESSSEVQEEKVVIIISKDEGSEIMTEKEISIEEGAILMDVMKENFDIEEEGGFITSIDGVAPAEDEKKAWMYFVNGEIAPVGAAEYELSAGDEVTFDLQSWE